MTDTQKIFALSVVAGGQDGSYIEQAPVYGWRWPRETWLEKRLAELRNKVDTRNNTSVE